MAGNKTRDGFRISFVERRVIKLYNGIESRQGSSHNRVLLAEGMRPCPLATSTDVRRMVVPWIREYLSNGNDNQSNSEIYNRITND